MVSSRIFKVVMSTACAWLFSVSAASATDYYLDSISGLDNNSGTSIAAPWKSLSKVNANNFRLNPGDTINFASGQTFTGGPLDVKGSGSAGSPIIYRIYNGTTPATIKSVSTTSVGVTISGKSYVTLQDLIITSDWDFATGAATNSGHGIKITSDCDYLTFDRVEVTKFSGKGIDFYTTNGSSEGLRIVNCNVHHTGNTAIKVAGGWTDATRQLNHANLYIGYTTVSYTKGGNTQDLKGSGIEISQVDGGIVEYCEASFTGTTWNQAAGGPVGIWCWDAEAIVIQYCYAHDNKNASGPYDGGGFDIDGGSTNCIVQYCYSHNNDGPGQFIAHFGDSHPTTNNIVRYNISQNDARATGQGAFNVWGASTNGFIYNNIVYGDKTLFRRENGGAETVVANNVFFASGTNNTLSSGSSSSITYRNNVWWAANGAPRMLWNSVTYTSLADFRAASGQEKVNGQPVGMQVNPQFVNAGAGPTTGVNVQQLATALAPYRLQSSSPLINKATDLAVLFGTGHPGARDFFGNTLPQSAGYDLGSHEYDGALPSAPLAPSNLAATLVTSGRIHLSWTDNATNEGNFLLERSVNGGAWSVADILSANATSWTWSGAAALTDYSFRLRAENAGGQSAIAGPLDVTTLAPPAAPGNLTLTRAGSSAIDLTWSNGSPIAEGFKIERSPDGVTFTQIGTVTANVTTYRSSGLAAATTYYFRFRAYDGTVNSIYSSVASIDTYPTVAATEVIDNTDAAKVTITGSWTSATSAVGYIGTNYIHDNIANKGTKSVRYTPSTLTPGLYEVRMSLPTSFSSWSTNAPVDITHTNGITTRIMNQQAGTAAWNLLGTFYFTGTAGNVTIRTTSSTGYVVADAMQFSKISDAMLRPPIALSTSAITATGFTVNWTNQSANEPGTRVEISTDGVAFTQAGIAATGANSLALPGLNPATNYTVRLAVFDEWNNALTSATTASATTLTRLAEWRQNTFPDPNAPNTANAEDYDGDGKSNILEYALATPSASPDAGTPAIDATTGRLKFTFTRPAISEVGYIIEASNELSAPWETIASLPAGSTTWTGPAAVDESPSGPVTSVVVTDIPLISGTSARFLRLRINY